MIKGLGFPCSNYFNTGILFATSFSHFVINTAVHAGYRQYYNNTIQQIYTCNPVSSLGCHHNIQSNLENHFVQKCIWDSYVFIRITRLDISSLTVHQHHKPDTWLMYHFFWSDPSLSKFSHRNKVTFTIFLTSSSKHADYCTAKILLCIMNTLQHVFFSWAIYLTFCILNERLGDWVNEWLSNWYMGSTSLLESVNRLNIVIHMIPDDSGFQIYCTGPDWPDRR